MILEAIIPNFKAAFTLTYTLTVYILLLNKKYVNGLIYMLKPEL